MESVTRLQELVIENMVDLGRWIERHTETSRELLRDSRKCLVWDVVERCSLAESPAKKKDQLVFSRLL